MPDNNQPITDAALAELDRVYKQCETSWIAIGHDLHSTYPALRERMRLAEAERDHHQLLREELMEQVHELKDELHCALYCLELNGIADDGVREKLAARDARMKREGAAGVWNQIAAIGRQVTDQFILVTVKYAEDQAAKLRKGGSDGN